MHAVELVFAIGWAAFWLYWLVAAFSMKRVRVTWSREWRIRAVILVLALLLVRLGAFRGHRLNSDPWRAGLGLILFAVGLGSAIWARVHIGRNWGPPMSQKNEPELITSGPYRPADATLWDASVVAGGTALRTRYLLDMSRPSLGRRAAVSVARGSGGAAPGCLAPRRGPRARRGPR